MASVVLLWPGYCCSTRLARWLTLWPRGFDLLPGLLTIRLTSSSKKGEAPFFQSYQGNLQTRGHFGRDETQEGSLFHSTLDLPRRFDAADSKRVVMVLYNLPASQFKIANRGDGF
jgi:hypothetical protein